MPETEHAMCEPITVVMRRGRIRIPASVRRALNLNAGDRVSVTLEAGGAKIVRRESIAERTAGMFRSSRPPLSAEEEREEAEWAVAQDAVNRMASSLPPLCVFHPRISPRIRAPRRGET